MRVMVTGASGFIGRHIVESAASRGHDVVAFVRNRDEYQSHQEQVIPMEGDVRDPVSIRSALWGCHSVIHAAALYTFDARYAKVMHEVNVVGTENVLRASMQEGVGRIVYTGTVGGSDFSQRKLAIEGDVAGSEAMTGPYKRSKFDAEQVVLRMVQKGAPIITVCPTAPLGPGDEKPTPTGKIVRDFLRRRMPGYIDTGLNFVHVQDVAEGHLLALERGEEGSRYLLGNVNGNLTLRQALLLLSELTGLPAPRLCMPHAMALAAAHMSEIAARALRKPSAIPLEAVQMARTRMWVDPSWSVEKLGLPQTPVRQAFRDAVEWFSGSSTNSAID